MNILHVKELQRWSVELDGVFTLPDLKVILGKDAPASLFRTLHAFIENGLLLRITRGLYATPEASLESVSFRICPAAYISTGTVLARHAIIGSIPALKLQAVKIGKTRCYTSDLGIIEHLGVAAHLYFGFLAEVGKPAIATPEKAFLDVCYFQYKGHRFDFDPDTDVDLDALNHQKLRDDLQKYDIRFRTYMKRGWGLGDA